MYSYRNEIKHIGKECWVNVYFVSYYCFGEVPGYYYGVTHNSMPLFATRFGKQPVYRLHIKLK